MKKIIFSLMFLIMLFIFTGCGEKSTIDEIESYLIENYPKEEFKILNKEYIESVEGSCKSDDNSNPNVVRFILKTGTEYKCENNGIDTSVSFGSYKRYCKLN